MDDTLSPIFRTNTVLRIFETYAAFRIIRRHSDGATDGHAKHFSVSCCLAARYHLTPLYDAISAQPGIDANQIRHNQFRLAMAVGDNRHYITKTIAARHFIQTANRTGIGEKVVVSIFDELRGAVEEAIDREAAKLPKSYPMEVAESIISGMKRRLWAI